MYYDRNVTHLKYLLFDYYYLKSALHTQTDIPIQYLRNLIVQNKIWDLVSFCLYSFNVSKRTIALCVTLLQYNNSSKVI